MCGVRQKLLGETLSEEASNHLVDAPGSDRLPDVTVCLVFQLAESITVESADIWRAGPLPLSLSSLKAAQPFAGSAMVADRDARAGAFGSRVSRVLYEANRRTGGGRWHRVASAVSPEGVELLGVERLVAPHSLVGATWLIAHVRSDAASPELLFALKDDTSALRLWLDPLLAGNVRLGRPFFVSHTAHETASLPNPPEFDGVVSASDAWAWVTGVGVPSAAFSLATGQPLPGTRLDLSADWFVQVFRDGLAFVADTPGLMGTTHARLREYVRSIYLDVFLLTRIQMAALASLAGELSESDLRRWTAEALDSLEAQFLDFRWRVWWRSVTGGGKVVDRLLNAIHGQLGLQEDVERVTSDIDSLRSYVRTRLDAEVNRRNEEAVRRATLLGGLWSLVATIFLPWSLIFSAIAITTDPEPKNLVVALVLGGLISTALLVAFPGIRPPRAALHELRVRDTEANGDQAPGKLGPGAS